MKRPLHQTALTAVAFAIFGLTAFAGILGALATANEVLSPRLTYIGTAVIAGAWIVASVWVRLFPVRWVFHGGHTGRITKLNFGVHCGFVGTLVLLWIPRISAPDVQVTSGAMELASSYDSNFYQLAKSPGTPDDKVKAFRAHLELKNISQVTITGLSLDTRLAFVAGRKLEPIHPYAPTIKAESAMVKITQALPDHLMPGESTKINVHELLTRDQIAFLFSLYDDGAGRPWPAPPAKEEDIKFPYREKAALKTRVSFPRYFVGQQLDLTDPRAYFGRLMWLTVKYRLATRSVSTLFWGALLCATATETGDAGLPVWNSDMMAIDFVSRMPYALVEEAGGTPVELHAPLATKIQLATGPIPSIIMGGPSDPAQSEWVAHAQMPVSGAPSPNSPGDNRGTDGARNVSRKPGYRPAGTQATDFLIFWLPSADISRGGTQNETSFGFEYTKGALASREFDLCIGNPDSGAHARQRLRFQRGITQWINVNLQKLRDSRVDVTKAEVAMVLPLKPGETPERGLEITIVTGPAKPGFANQRQGFRIHEAVTPGKP